MAAIREECSFRSIFFFRAFSQKSIEFLCILGRKDPPRLRRFFFLMDNFVTAFPAFSGLPHLSAPYMFFRIWESPPFHNYEFGRITEIID